MVAKVLGYILLFISSALKYSFAAFAVLAGNMGPWGTFSNVLGGIVGIVAFTVFGDYLKKFLISRNPKKYGMRFTKYTRKLVFIKKYIGLGGLAFITPILLSIPLGVSLALVLTSNERKIITYMILSLFFWALVFFVPYYLFHIDLATFFKNLFA